MSLSPPTNWKSLLPLLVLISLYTLALTLLEFHGRAPSDRLTLLWKITFALFIVRWVSVDRRCRELSLPFEFDAFLFFGWILLFPWYLFKTRGARGLLSAIGLSLLALAPSVVAEILWIFRGP